MRTPRPLGRETIADERTHESEDLPSCISSWSLRGALTQEQRHTNSTGSNEAAWLSQAVARLQSSDYGG